MKREREKHITRLHIILFLLVIISGITIFIFVKAGSSKKISRYQKLEKDFNTATKYYYGNKEKEVEKGRRKIITMKTIVDNGYLQDEITNKCVGYTIVSNYRNLDNEYNINYETYIKCGDAYQTVGYEADITE